VSLFSKPFIKLSNFLNIVCYYTINLAISQRFVVRCPGHTIQFLGFNYRGYVDQVLELAELDYITAEEVKKYENWTPFPSGSGSN